MKFLIQRVTGASVSVDGEVIGQIGKGLLVLVGIARDDDGQVADKLVRKLVGLRIFEDQDGKTNLSLSDVDGQLLLISQFTLYADCRRGNLYERRLSRQGGRALRVCHRKMQGERSRRGTGTFRGGHESLADQ